MSEKFQPQDCVCSRAGGPNDGGTLEYVYGTTAKVLDRRTGQRRLYPESQLRRMTRGEVEKYFSQPFPSEPMPHPQELLKRRLEVRATSERLRQEDRRMRRPRQLTKET